jgi:hypothetical protein
VRTHGNKQGCQDMSIHRFTCLSIYRLQAQALFTSYKWNESLSFLVMVGGTGTSGDYHLGHFK